MKRWIIYALCLFAATACAFLEENPRDQREKEAVLESDATLYLHTLGNLYSLIGGSEDSQGLAGTCRGVYDLNTFTTDEAILPTRGGDWYDGGLWQRLYLHRWEDGEAPFKGTWDYLYKVIVLANQAIVDLSGKPEWQQEARALRALYYYYLMDLFGRVPIVTSPDVSLAEVKQSSRAELFRFVTSELSEADRYLETVASNRHGIYYGRMTSPVVWFLLAKCYLNAEVYTGEPRYEEALQYCSRLASIYELEPLYSSNFAVNNENSVENIFTIPMDKHLFHAQNQYLFRSRHYDHAAALGFTGENGASATPEVLRANAYDTPQEDPRFAINYWAGTPIDLSGEEISAVNYKPWSICLDLTGEPDEKMAGARMRKYAIDPNAMKDGKLMDNDWVLFRYADVLLIQAEALLRTGHPDEALPYVNQVRSRAGAEKLEQLTLDILLEERLRELAWEGWRRQDLIRFGRFGQAWSFREPVPGEETGYTQVFPIPADVLALNPNLSQNEGY